MPPQVFQYLHRVTYADCTVGNHVYYARYLDHMETARGEFFRALGMTFRQWQEKEIIFPVVECQVRYCAPARYDDVLTVELWLGALERIRLAFSYRILNKEGKDLVHAATRHVCTNLQEKPRRIPEDLVARLKPFLSAARAPVSERNSTSRRSTATE